MPLTTVTAACPMRVNHHWTDEEREIVRRDYRGDKANVAALAVKLGVTFQAVKRQAQKFHVMRHKSPDWTTEEEARLTELIPQYSPRRISQIMGRSETAVIVKAKRLHLSRRHRDGWYTKQEACEILGVDHHKFELWERAGWITMKPHHEGSIPCKEGGACWHIDERELKNFILNHVGELVGRNVDLFQIVTIIGPAQLGAGL